MVVKSYIELAYGSCASCGESGNGMLLAHFQPAFCDEIGSLCKECIIKAVNLFSEADMKPKVPGENYPIAHHPNVWDGISWRKCCDCGTQDGLIAAIGDGHRCEPCARVYAGKCTEAKRLLGLIPKAEMAKPDPTDYSRLLTRMHGLFDYDFPRNPEMERHLL